MSFYEIRSFAIYLYIAIKHNAFNRINRAQPNILQRFLEYLEFYTVAC